MISFCLSTYNNLPYLIECIKSVRSNAFYKNAPFIVHAENCTDGTNEWINDNAKIYDLEIYIEPKVEPARGIGGGMNFCASKVKTKYIIFLQSDFYVCNNFDFELLNEIEKYQDTPTVVSSWRIQPDIFKDTPRAGTIFIDPIYFGSTIEYFKQNYKQFLDYTTAISKNNINISIRRAEGAGGYIISKKDWDYIGGNDSLFAPVSFEDMDLFIRMQLEGYNFVQIARSIIWHYAGRGSHRLEENNGKSSERQRTSEINNQKKWLQKWGAFPEFDEYGFVKPIHNTKVSNRLIYDITNNTSYDFK